MIPVAVGILGRMAVQFAARHYAKKAIIGGVKSLFSSDKDDAQERASERHAARTRTHGGSEGGSMFGTAVKFGALAGVAVGGVALARTERGQEFIKDVQASAGKLIAGTPLEGIKEKAVEAIAHRINAEGMFSNLNVSEKMKQMSGAAAEFANGSFMSALKGVGDKLNPADFKKYMALGATLAAPFGVKAIETIKDTGLVEQAQGLAASLLKGEMLGHVGARPGANAAPAEAAPHRQMQYETMAG